jgi:Ni,Fe-hydrogenase I cytochrome b subunit
VEPGRPEEVAPPSAPPLRLVRAEYQHPWAIRFTHWLNAVSIFVLVASGVRIFTAFPSFGPKVPQ